MIIQCQSCSRKFIVKDTDIPSKGRTVQCGYCSVTWHQMPILIKKRIVKEKTKILDEKNISVSKNEERKTSFENVKASDGKTYRFLGNQWAQLMPSGKTGLFAKKQITKELNDKTGRKEKKIIKKRKKKIDKVDPSSISQPLGKQLPDIYKPKEGLGFFGYIFLIIIIGFSIVGVLKTFENDLINAFPQAEYIFQLLDEQLKFLAETVKNMVVIVKDLTSSY